MWASKIHVPDLCSQKLKHNLPLCSLLLHCPAMAPKAATSAAQPVARHLHCSAAQPAAQPAELNSLHSCKEWLKTVPPQKIDESQPLRRLSEAMILLTGPRSRQQRQDAQRLSQDWNVPQKTQRRKRSFDELKADLTAKVVEETRRLQKMQDTPGAACFSAIQAAIQHTARPQQNS
jgi:hypothetical protein